MCIRDRSARCRQANPRRRGHNARRRGRAVCRVHSRQAGARVPAAGGHSPRFRQGSAARESRRPRSAEGRPPRKGQIEARRQPGAAKTAAHRRPMPRPTDRGSALRSASRHRSRSRRSSGSSSAVAARGPQYAQRLRSALRAVVGAARAFGAESFACSIPSRSLSTGTGGAVGLRLQVISGINRTARIQIPCTPPCGGASDLSRLRDSPDSISRSWLTKDIAFPTLRPTHITDIHCRPVGHPNGAPPA
jgi:hypothetical protein